MTHSNVDYLGALSAFVCDTHLEELPRAALDRARWVIADSLAIIAAGMQAPEMKDFGARYLAGAPSRGARVIGARRRARRVLQDCMRLETIADVHAWSSNFDL